MLEIESEKLTHCREMVTGRNLTGTVILSEKSIGAKIYSYDGSFYIDGNLPIFLQAETNEIVSLYSNITDPPGSTWRDTEPKRTTYRQEVLQTLRSSATIVGRLTTRSSASRSM